MPKKFCLFSLLSLLTVTVLHAAPQQMRGELPEIEDEPFTLFEGDIRVPESFDEGSEELDIDDEPFTLFEGDILVPKSFYRTKRNAVADRNLLWPNGVIPYTISSKFSSQAKDLFRSAMKMIEDATKVGDKKCIQFSPRTRQASYIHLEQYRDCSSEVGRRGNRKQIVALGNQCYKKGTIVHELLHSLGFAHEHSRPDRDEFIDVHYENIRTGAESNFKQYAEGSLTDLGFPYDYDSIMHYEADSFSKKPSHLFTITPKIHLPNGFKLGQRDHLSVVDIEMIRTLYGCLPVEEVKTDSVCKDKLKYCFVYGESMCTRYPNWAGKHCAQTCNLCSAACEDKVNDCYAYGDDVCTAYKSWAQSNCARYCGFTDCDPEMVPGADKDVTAVSTTPAAACADKLDCTHLAKSTCSMSYMKTNCAKFCSLCTEHTTTLPPKTTPTTRQPITTKGADVCKDEINDCHDYTREACKDYPYWANNSCRLYCGLCQTKATSTSASKATQQGACGDTIDDCSAYDVSVCEDYPVWSKTNCRQFCGFCDNVEVTSAPTEQQGACKDKINDCSAYDASVCEDYLSWSETNCRHFCGLCDKNEASVKPACVDKKNDCSEYATEVCTSYAAWAKTNCALFCGLCD